MYSGRAKLSESSTATALGSMKTEKMKEEGAVTYGKNSHRKHVIVPTMHGAQICSEGRQISDQTLRYDLHSVV